jgi:CheY-like chemotaxis protein
MGLSVVLGIVQSCGGAILVETELGKGTTLRLYLPVTEGRESPGIRGETLSMTNGKERIVFIDDEPMLVDANVDWLRSLGYDVTGYSSSIEALHYIRQHAHDIDMVITDQTMPGVTGTELVREALAIRHDLPVILCTGYSREINSEQAADLGISRFLMKPYRSQEISRIIREVLDKE